jgi:hypothetical protein
MDFFLDARTPGGLLTSVPDDPGVDRRITVMVVAARKEPDAGFSA